MEVSLRCFVVAAVAKLGPEAVDSATDRDQYQTKPQLFVFVFVLEIPKRVV
jgi:hypothetical protein